MGPLRHSYNSHGHGTNLLSANEVPLSHDIRHDTSSGGRIFESKSLGVGRGNHTLENGAHRHVGRRGSAHAKELDSFANIIEGKPSKRNQCGYRSQVLLPNFSGECILLSGCLVACTIVELLAMWNLIKVEVQLCNMLSPEGPRVSLRSYNWGLVFIAMLVDNSLQHREGIAPKFYITL